MFELTPFERRNHVVSYNPFRELEELERNFFGNQMTNHAFQTDIQDLGDAYLLETDLPGFQKEDIHLDLDDNYLTIRAERNTNLEQKDKRGNYLRRERSYGAFQRSFDVSAVKVDEIKAQYQDGVLKLTLPKKKEEHKNSTRQIDIE